MTDDEWGGLCLIIEEAWPGEFGDAARTAWRVLLDDYSADQVIVGLKTLIAKPSGDDRSRRFRPSVSEVVAAIRHDPTRPTGGEVAELLWGKGGVMYATAEYRPGGFGPGERKIADDQAKLNVAASHSRLLHAFVSRVGLDRLRALDPREPEHGAGNRVRLEQEWERFCERADERQTLSLIRGNRGELAPVDPLSSLRLIGGGQR